jgi:hypothetical protein
MEHIEGEFRAFEAGREVVRLELVLPNGDEFEVLLKGNNRAGPLGRLGSWLGQHLSEAAFGEEVEEIIVPIPDSLRVPRLPETLNTQPELRGVWDELEPVLLELEEAGALLQRADSCNAGGDNETFMVLLKPSATEEAEMLHQRFGNALTLQVGAMLYPDRRLPGWAEPQSSTLLDPNEITADFEDPCEFASGQLIVAELWLHNQTDGTPFIESGRRGFETRLVDLDSGEIVGGFRDYMPKFEDLTAELKLTFAVFSHPEDHNGYSLQPQGRRRALRPLPIYAIPASTNPELGYAIPPGEWGLVVYMWVAEEYKRTPPIPITIT